MGDNEIHITYSYLTIKAPQNLHKAIQHICIEMGVNQQDFILELISDKIKDTYKAVLSEQNKQLEIWDMEG